jgi:hypothetical protein
MPELKRRRSSDHRHKCWHIYHGDVHVGTIAERVGNPHDTDQWEWNCGFYPGSEPGKYQSDTAATFAEARADFEREWRVFLSKRTEADLKAWRDQRDWTARKYALWIKAKRLEPPAMDRGNCASVPEVSLRRDIRHARPRGGAGACASHLGGRTRLKRMPSRVPSSLRLRVVASHHHVPSLSSRVAR